MSIQKINYVNYQDIRSVAEEMIKDLACSNGHAEMYYVTDPAENEIYSANKKLNDYFIEKGLKPGERILIHVTW